MHCKLDTLKHASFAKLSSLLVSVLQWFHLIQILLNIIWLSWQEE